MRPHTHVGLDNLTQEITMHTHTRTPRRATPRSALAVRLAAGALGAAALCSGHAALAQEFVLHAEADAGFWVDQPQTQRFTPVFYGAVRPGITVGRHFSFQLSYAAIVAAPREGFEEIGVGHFLTGGVRLKPLASLRDESKQLDGLFIDFNAGYVRTGELNRFGFDAGLGYNFQVAPTFAFGPVVRYVHIVQPDNLVGFSDDDGQLLTVGLNFSFGPAYKEEVDDDEAPPVCPTLPDQPPAADCPPPAVVTSDACPDRDKDGVCDGDDRCPYDAGPTQTYGCPTDPCSSGKPLSVLVQFPYDSSAMPALRSQDPQTMDPVLDAVAWAIAQDPSCRVCIIGHTSEEGTDQYNLDLSDRRAKAVQDYMTGKGVDKKRIPFTGLGASCQLTPEDSLPMNRRVEFRRLLEGESCPTDCSEPARQPSR